MKILFRRVLGIRAQGPVILAVADREYVVRWQPRTGWSCTCDEELYPVCPHIPAVKAHIDVDGFTDPDRGLVW